MSRPEDESRTELAWREIVEHYGERPVLDDASPAAEPVPPTSSDASPTTDLPDDLVDDDPVERREQAVAESERFRPPPAPPFPAPRTWQRGLAWSGLFVAPLIALLLGIFSLYVTPLIGWALVGWFVGGFAYLVREMPRAPRDPWDDGSRI
ncbi:hypothetical protein GCM10011376_18730 [Nocardioides flavus (ex Wang et al. 2016)]|uniref:Uncharacterized protein n=1 Tax=Nocardioides flavus (ex Wang et al. 2016) TaxID=2058780 RepID=A0ABQ3HHY0_9ACTN|nr:hypothetical protein [Nocardioides flavus (ex Wang et al. 2016)]GHE17263.1 hypothetical protein GCM10011376_18730 [Nocardioides flavus (ex Wang et al. 2016)]